MKFLFFPNPTETCAEGKVEQFIRKDLSKRKDLQVKVQRFLDHVRAVTDLDIFFKAKTIAQIREGLCEMRIPPEHNKGVVRIYFVHDPKDSETLVLLDAELKQGRSEGSRIDNAIKRMRKYLLFRKEN